MLEMFQLPFMQQALLACLLFSVVLSYLGVHVVGRGIVFIDLALAQLSSVGVALALFTGGNPELYAIAFTLVGAVGFSLLKTGTSKVPQEAVIGIIYAVASAVTILLMAKTPHGDSDMISALLFGNILSLDTTLFTQMAWVFAGVILLNIVLFKPLWASTFGEEAKATGKKAWALQLLFYISLALAISEAIRAAGVLLVFAYLVVPAVSALFFGVRPALVLPLSIGLAVLSSILGLTTSFAADLPTGAAIVTSFGLLFAVSVGVASLLKRKSA